MGQNENAREPLDALQAERPLTIKFLAAPLPACHQRPMTILGLFQISSRAFDSSLSVFRETSDQLIFAIEKLGQRQLHVLGNALDFGGALAADFVQKSAQSVFVQPGTR